MKTTGVYMVYIIKYAPYIEASDHWKNVHNIHIKLYLKQENHLQPISFILTIINVIQLKFIVGNI